MTLFVPVDNFPQVDRFARQIAYFPDCMRSASRLKPLAGQSIV